VDHRHLLDLVAALSRQTDLAVGCTRADEARCHLSMLRVLLAERGAELASADGLSPVDRAVGRGHDDRLRRTA